LEHVTLTVDDEAKAPAAGKERHSIPPFILIGSQFIQAGDPSLAHSLLTERQLDPEALRDGPIDLNGAILKLDHCHHGYHPLMRGDREFSIAIYLCPGLVAAKAKPPGSRVGARTANIDSSGTVRQRWG
jgi:hypothetical protein